MTLPGSMQTAEGNGAHFVGSFFGPVTHQYQVAESELIAQGIGPGFVFTGLRLRHNGGATTNPGDINFLDFEVLLGEAVNTIAGMSTTFADNVTGGQIARSGPLTLAANSMPGGSTPNAFGPSIAFTAPYTYQGGDLILQLRRTTGTSSIAFDASSSHTSAGTEYGSVIGTYTGTTGTLSNFMVVSQLDYSVPEPGAATLLLTGLALVAAGGWRRSQR